MKTYAVLGGVAALLTAGAAAAAPGLEIRDSAVRVTIIPEARSDILVTVSQTNPRLPLRIRRVGDGVVVDGGLMGVGMNCHSMFGKAKVSIWGKGDFAQSELPILTVHTPMDVKVGAGGAVFGVIGRGASVQLANSGCGDWTVANVSGPLHLSLSGSGDVHAGSSGPAEIHTSGSGDVFARVFDGGLTAGISGSGDIHAEAVNGPLVAHIAGSGDVVANGGAVTDLQVAIAGSGDVTFHGVAQTLKASIAGSGDVVVGHVTGAVSKHIAGSGDVRIGS
jgi:hypothetical protein